MKAVELHDLLVKSGLSRVRLRGRNIMACCPYHEEQNPSWGISLQEPHPHGCFSCGAKGTLYGLLCHLGRLTITEIERLALPAPSSAFPLFEHTEKEPEPFLDKSELYPFQMTEKAFAFLKKRGISRRLALKLGCCYDTQQDRVLFPWFLGKRLVGTTGRALDPENGVKMLPYWGTMKSRWLYLPQRGITKGPLCLVEGEIDAARVYASGFQNVGALGQGRLSEGQKDFALNSEATELIVFTDDDPAGIRLRLSIAKQFKDCSLSVHHVDYAPFRSRYGDDKIDPGLMTLKDLRDALSKQVKTNSIWPEF
jgi:DNA primase